jgi:hypothetical protein
MLHLVVLAMADLWVIDPDAAKAPTPQLGQRLAGLGETSSTALDSNDAPGPLTLEFCTYGTPPLGPHLWGDASDLMRTLTAPSCSDDEMSASQTGFASGSFVRMFPLGIGQLWQPFSLGAVTRPIDAAPLRPMLSVPTGFTGASPFAVHLPQGMHGPALTPVRHLSR